MRKVMMRRADAPIWQEVERRCIRCVMDFAWRALEARSDLWLRGRAQKASARVRIVARHGNSRLAVQVASWTSISRRGNALDANDHDDGRNTFDGVWFGRYGPE